MDSVVRSGGKQRQVVIYVSKLLIENIGIITTLAGALLQIIASITAGLIIFGQICFSASANLEHSEI